MSGAARHGCQIAPSTYYAAKPDLPRRGRYATPRCRLRSSGSSMTRNLGRGLADARKVWPLPHRDHSVADRFGPVARCTVERLMRQAGLQDARRGSEFVTTRPDKSADRPPDRVNRDFTAKAPNGCGLWTSPMWRPGRAWRSPRSFSRRIVGWRTTCSMPIQLPLDALEMALWTRSRAGHTECRGCARLEQPVANRVSGRVGSFGGARVAQVEVRE